MIKANELRIGNWVAFDSGIQKRKVQVNARFFSSLAAGRPVSEMKTEEELSAYWSGIFLTPEILEKCGFEKILYKGTFESFQLGKLYVVFLRDKCECYYGENSEPIYIKHLHQLQNIFLDLTGEELPVNL